MTRKTKKKAKMKRKRKQNFFSQSTCLVCTCTKSSRSNEYISTSGCCTIIVYMHAPQVYVAWGVFHFFGCSYLFYLHFYHFLTISFHWTLSHGGLTRSLQYVIALGTLQVLIMETLRIYSTLNLSPTLYFSLLSRDYARFAGFLGFWQLWTQKSS